MAVCRESNSKRQSVLRNANVLRISTSTKCMHECVFSWFPAFGFHSCMQTCALQMTLTCRIVSHLPAESQAHVVEVMSASSPVATVFPYFFFYFFFCSSSIRKEMCVSISRNVLEFAGRIWTETQMDCCVFSTVQMISEWSTSCRLASVTPRNHWELIVSAVKGQRKIQDNQHVI